MDRETQIPQDPNRFSKSRAEPPILDLKATEHHSESDNAEHTVPPKTETELPPPYTKPRSYLSISGFVGGTISGGIISLGLLGYSYITGDLPTKIARLEQALATKSDQDEATKFNARLTALETALADTKSTLAVNAKKSVSVDPSLLKRLDEIETAFKSLSGREPMSANTNDHRALRLALILLLRDTLKSDHPASNIIAALDSTGENHPAFVKLKDQLASPLQSYAALIDEAMSQMKSRHDKIESKSDDVTAPSRFPSFLSQLITVRPAKMAEPTPVEPNDIIEPVVTALEDQRADEALKLMGAIPEGTRSTFKILESDIARRANAEAAIAALLDDALDAITKGDKP